MTGLQQLKTSLNRLKRGYRSNRWLDMVRPNPHPKQKWFLASEWLEVMYGGAAGGGKSDALLMAALQYIDVPGYAAIIFRNSYEDLSLPGAIMDRASQWLTGLPGVTKRDGGRRWEFEGGGTLQFSYMENPEDRMRYKSAEFQFVGFDECTSIPFQCIKYLFSRLRKPSDPNNPLSKVPLRMRLATNPGGKYSEDVKNYFVPRKYLQADEDTQFSRVWATIGPCGVCDGKKQIEVDNHILTCESCNGSGVSKRYFIPARLQDNPTINYFEYKKSLAELPPEERAALEHGRWDLVTDGKLFRSAWFRHWEWNGEHIILNTIPGNPNGRIIVPKGDHWTFMTVDTAQKIQTVNDYTCIVVWTLCEPGKQLCRRYVFRQRILIPLMLPMIKELYEKYNCRFVMIEDASSGIAVIQEAKITSRGAGLTVISYNPSNKDKVQRSTDSRLMMEAGKIFFSQSDDVVETDCNNELLSFPDGVHDDYVDNQTMAAWYANTQSRTIRGHSGPAGQLVKQSMSYPRFNRY